MFWNNGMNNEGINLIYHLFIESMILEAIDNKKEFRSHRGHIILRHKFDSLLLKLNIKWHP